jgi:heme A synthase
MKLDRFAKYSWGVLIFNLMVILWGAYVRATGSGAGCGSHWPLCNGELLPRAPQIETIVEFTHRISSGMAFLLVLVMFLWARKLYQPKHGIRVTATWAMILMITESLAGATLVIFHWVAGDTSVARVIMMGVHLLNTHMLLAFITLTAWWSSGGKIPTFKRDTVKWLLIIGLIATLLLSIAGAITALGDTLFQVDSLAEGIQQDLDPTSHFLVRLRVLHPAIAISVGLYLAFVTGFEIRKAPKESHVRRFAIILLVIYGVQLMAGLVNLLLLAPVWLQIVHLFLADLVWIFLVLLMSEKTFLASQESA